MKVQSLVRILIIAALLLGMMTFVSAQDEADDLVCPDFVGSANDVRIGYYMGEGAAFFTSGQVNRAIDSFSCVIEQIDDSYVPAYMRRAAAYTERRAYDLAIEDYTSAINLDSSLIAAFNNRGIVYTAQQDYENALADFNQALNLNSSFRLGLNNRAVVYAIQGDYDTAIADLEEAIALSGVEDIVAELNNPERAADAPFPVFDRRDAQAYALLGIIYSSQALDNYQKYLTLTRSSGDRRVQSAAGALESRFTFELRLDDGTWLLAAAFTPSAP